MTHTEKLELALDELLSLFDAEPESEYYTVETKDGEVVEVSPAMHDAIQAAMEVMYDEPEDEDEY